MSAALYAIRLMWLDGRGDIAACGIHAHLSCAPDVLVLMGIVEIQYEPALQCFWCRDSMGAPRDMTKDEAKAIRAWVENRAAAARAALEEKTGVHH